MSARLVLLSALLMGGAVACTAETDVSLDPGATAARPATPAVVDAPTPLQLAQPAPPPLAGGIPNDAIHAGVRAGVPSSPQPMAPNPGVATGPPGSLETAIPFIAPTSWTREPPASGMRVAQWLLGTRGDDRAECVLFRFPGGGGGIDENITRWIRQFENPIAGQMPDAERATAQIRGGTAHLVRARGTYLSQGMTMQGPMERYDDFALWGAILAADGDPWFLKCTGPAEVIDRHQEGFQTVLASFGLP